ncbi:hypothetical protein D3C71_1597280 [compost metagenome]
MAFDGRTRAVGNDGHFVIAGQLHCIGHVLGAFGKHHGGGRRRLQRAFIAAMLLAHGQGLRALGTEAGHEGVEESRGHRTGGGGGQQVLGSDG